VRTFLKFVVVYSGSIVAIALVLSFLSTFVSPAVFWPLAYFGLAFPVLLILNAIVFVLLVIKRKKSVIIPLLAFIICLEPASNFFQMRFHAPKTNFEHRDLKILTYNVHLFNLINWNNTPDQLLEIISFIKQENPDIVCLQEFCQTNTATVKKRLKMLYADYPYRHISYTISSKKYNFGIVTLSKYPIVNREGFPFEKTANATIYSDIKIGDDTIRLYNSHLQSTRLREKNLNLLIYQKFQNNSKKMDELKDINSRLKLAFEKRANQVDMVSDARDKSPYPVIMVGDYNDPPTSYSYRKMRGNLTDSFKEVGVGIGSTYYGFFPILRIDYVFHSPLIMAIGYESPHIDYSDHYPVVVNLALPLSLKQAAADQNN